MITCKEDLINTYIDNSNDELFSVWFEIVKELAEKDDRDVDWLKLNKFSSVEGRVDGELFVNSIDGVWLKNKKELTLGDFKQKRTKVEFVKSNLSIGDFIDGFQKGLLFYYQGGEYNQIDTERQAMFHADRGSYFVKVETEIDERQEFIDAAMKSSGIDCLTVPVKVFENMYDSGKFKLIED